MTSPVTKRSFLLLSAAAGVSACSPAIISTPSADQVLVTKSERRMYLIRGDKSLKQYSVGLGFAPAGHKEREGDGRTPEGFYWIDRKNPRSDFHLSLGISYPNENDAARAEALGVRPGGDIFIHGGPNRASQRGNGDWTAGCIAVTDRQIEEIYALVRLGTPVVIQA